MKIAGVDREICAEFMGLQAGKWRSIRRGVGRRFCSGRIFLNRSVLYPIILAQMPGQNRTKKTERRQNGEFACAFRGEFERAESGRWLAIWSESVID